ACGSGSPTDAPSVAPPTTGNGTPTTAPTGGEPTGSEPTGGESGPRATPGQIGGSVTVIGTWGGDEEQAFLQIVAPFEEQTGGEEEQAPVQMVAPVEERTGVEVQYTGTGDLNAVLTTGVASGILPDLAGLPGPGQMGEFARAGKRIDLGTVLDTATYTEQTAP